MSALGLGILFKYVSGTPDSIVLAGDDNGALVTVALVATDTPLSILAKTEEAYANTARGFLKMRYDGPQKEFAAAQRKAWALGRFSIARSSMMGPKSSKEELAEMTAIGALYGQAIDGDVTAARPMWPLPGREAWDAKDALRGTTKREAMAQYTGKVDAWFKRMSATEIQWW